MSNISKSDVEHVATLARLKLTNEETEKFTHEIGDILNYVEELNQTSTYEVAEAGQGSELANIARNDEVTNPNDRENLLSNAPSQKNGFISVPSIFNNKTETSFPEAKPKDANE